MTATTPPDLNLRVLAEAFHRWEQNPQPVSIAIESRVEAWMLMGLLQLVCRHPDLSEELSQLAERLARMIQSQVCDTDQLADLAELGWNSHLDYDHGQQGGAAR